MNECQAQCATRSAATRSVAQRAHATHARRTRTTCQCITLQCAQHCAQTARSVHCQHGTMLCAQSCHLSSSPVLLSRPVWWHGPGDFLVRCDGPGRFPCGICAATLLVACCLHLRVPFPWDADNEDSLFPTDAVDAVALGTSPKPFSVVNFARGTTRMFLQSRAPPSLATAPIPLILDLQVHRRQLASESGPFGGTGHSQIASFSPRRKGEMLASEFQWCPPDHACAEKKSDHGTSGRYGVRCYVSYYCVEFELAVIAVFSKTLRVWQITGSRLPRTGDS